MGIESDMLGYLAGVALIAVLVGLAIGYVVKTASTRRQLAPLQDEVTRLKTELARAQERHLPAKEAPTPAARRVTPTELVAILGAIGTLISTTAAFYNNYQGKSLKELQEKLTASEAKLKTAEGDVAKVRTDAQGILGFKLEKWLQLDKTSLPTQKPKRPETFQIADRDVSGPCDDQRLQLAYNGYAPAVVRCKGRVVINLSQASRVMLAPETSK